MHLHLLLLFLRTHHRSIQLAHLFLTQHSPRWKGLIAPLEISCSNLVFCRILQSEALKKEWQVWPLCCPSCKIISSSHPLSVLALLATFAVLVQNWKVELFLLFLLKWSLCLEGVCTPPCWQLEGASSRLFLPSKSMCYGSSHWLRLQTIEPQHENILPLYLHKINQKRIIVTSSSDIIINVAFESK